MAGRRSATNVTPLGRFGLRSISACQPSTSSTHLRTSMTQYSALPILHGRSIVRSFVDAGKSGVGIRRRNALQELLRVVERGEADFSTILVYDVSRWGRFQEPDEGAYYEFRCIRAGMTVEYCAEHFPSDNAPMSAVMKSMKRAMSGELSRDLSTKVFAGQCRLITLGFRQGGTPGYGLRRLLLDQYGQPKTTLGPGDRKSFQLERVILTPGPDEEVETVRRVYALFIAEHKTETEIATLLNSEGVSTATGRLWSRGTIHELPHEREIHREQPIQPHQHQTPATAHQEQAGRSGYALPEGL